MQQIAVSDGPWYPVKMATEELHISRSTLYRLRNAGRLKPGVHFLRTTPGKTGKVLWCPGAIRHLMASWDSPLSPGSSNCASKS